MLPFSLLVCYLPTGVDDGGPAGVLTGALLDSGVDDGGPAGVSSGAVPSAGVELGGPLGVVPEFVSELFVPPESWVSFEVLVPDGGVTPAQNCVTVSLAAVAALRRLLKATLCELA